jgi:hypothetical protein
MTIAQGGYFDQEVVWGMWLPILIAALFAVFIGGWIIVAVMKGNKSQDK